MRDLAPTAVAHSTAAHSAGAHSAAAVALGACFVLSALSTSPCTASSEPAGQVQPTGCITKALGMEIEARPAWGIAPFESDLSVSITAGNDSIEAVWWDFDGDGTVDAGGIESRRLFPQAIDYAVTAVVRTSYRGDLRLKRIVSGHTAVMSLTFDDGKIGVYYQAMPELRARGVTGTCYIVPDWTNTTHSQFMDWWHIVELHQLGWDIGSHTMSHPYLTEMDDSTLQYELIESKAELMRRGILAENFALPYGDCDERVMREVKKHYSSSRAVEGEINPAPNRTGAYAMKCMTGLADYPPEHYRAHIDSAVARAGWYILNNHNVWYSCHGSPWCIDVQVLAGIVDYALERRVKVANIAEALEYARIVRGGNQVAREVLADIPKPPPVVWYFRNPLGVPGTIEFQLPIAAAAQARLYDCRGRHVVDLDCGSREKTRHRISWDGLNSDGEPVAGGAYYCVVTVGGESHSSGPILVLR
jgi:peptidoglycan/xylan/chitin deacetylase (PgdA/CDA1 family)